MPTVPTWAYPGTKVRCTNPASTYYRAWGTVQRIDERGIMLRFERDYPYLRLRLTWEAREFWEPNWSPKKTRASSRSRITSWERLMADEDAPPEPLVRKAVISAPKVKAVLKVKKAKATRERNSRIRQAQPPVPQRALLNRPTADELLARLFDECGPSQL